MKNDLYKIVRGNDFNLIIKVREVITDELGNPTYLPFDFSGSDVNIRIVGSYQKYTFPFDVEGNIITIHVDGKKISNGTYGVEIMAEKDGNRRSFKRCQFAIVESDDEAGLVESPEFGVQTVELDTQVIIGSISGGSVDLSDYYTKDEVDKELKNKVSIAPGKGLSENDYTDEDKTKLSELHNYDDSGIYPDKYLAQITYPYKANEEGIMKFGYQFYDLPNGNYRVKILASTIKEGFSGTGELGYNINDTEQKVDANFPLNNLSEFIVFDSVAVTDGIIDLTFYNVSDTALNPMVSVVEIEEL